MNSSQQESQKMSVQTQNILDIEQHPGQIDDRWSELKIAGKNLQGRSYHTLVLYKNKVYTYGGYEVDKGILDDFYEMQITDCDVFEWIPVSINKSCKVSPGPRRRHSVIMFEDKMYLFGGQHSTTQNNNEVWYYDFTNSLWKKVNTKGNSPPPIDSHSAVKLNNEEMLIFGGYLGNQGSDTNSIYSFNIQTETWTQILEASDDKSAPQKRSGSGCVATQDSLYLFGGMNTGADIKFDDIWKFNINAKTWEKLQPTGDVFPENRNGHSIIYYNNYIFIFGGIQNVTKEKNDIYAYDIKNNKWIRVHTNTSNLYSMSPGLKKGSDKKDFKIKEMKKNKGSNSPTKKDSNKKTAKFERSLSPNKTQQVSDMVETNFVDEKKKQKQAEQKARMLHDIDNVDYSQKNNNQSSSPTTEAIKNSINRLGDQSKDMKKGKKNENYALFEEILPPVKFKMGQSLLIGKKPCERDGQASCLVDNKMLIFGGDRHLFSFNDIYFFDLDMALQKHIDYE